MTQSVLSIRMDDYSKQEFDNICKELGMTMSAAVNMLAKKMVRERRLPFDVSIDPFYSESNMKALGESLQQLRNGKVVVKTFEELDALACEEQ